MITTKKSIWKLIKAYNSAVRADGDRLDGPATGLTGHLDNPSGNGVPRNREVRVSRWPDGCREPSCIFDERSNLKNDTWSLCYRGNLKMILDHYAIEVT